MGCSWARTSAQESWRVFECPMIFIVFREGSVTLMFLHDTVFVREGVTERGGEERERMSVCLLMSRHASWILL